jgi:hypothetical protein
LGRIDKDRDDHAIGTAVSPAHQGNVPFMQCAHRWYQSSFSASRAEIRNRGAQRRYRADDTRTMFNLLGNLHDDVAA